MKPASANPLNDRLADGVRRLGFRKWYERELLAGHAHMVLAVLAVIAMLASFEAFRGGSLSEKLLDVLFVIVCGGVGYWALRRYLFLLMRAEVVANQAVCGQCGEYGRFDVVGENPGMAQTQVCCRKCQFRWVISDGD